MTSYHVNVEELRTLNGMIFESPDASWAGFIYNNRMRQTISSHHSKHQNKLTFIDHNLNLQYDFVYGPVADGRSMEDVFYKLSQGMITVEEFLTVVRPQGTLTDQLSIHSERAKRCLTLTSEVTNDEQIREASRQSRAL